MMPEELGSQMEIMRIQEQADRLTFCQNDIENFF